MNTEDFIYNSIVSEKFPNEREVILNEVTININSNKYVAFNAVIDNKVKATYLVLPKTGKAEIKFIADILQDKNENLRNLDSEIIAGYVFGDTTDKADKALTNLIKSLSGNSLRKFYEYLLQGAKNFKDFAEYFLYSFCIDFEQAINVACRDFTDSGWSDLYKNESNRIIQEYVFDITKYANF